MISFLKAIAGKSQRQHSVETFNSGGQLNFQNIFNVNYYFLRVLGLWPFSFVRDSSGKIQKPQVTKIDLLWFIISTLFYLSVSTVFLKDSLKFATRFERSKYVYNIISSGDYGRIVFSLIFVALLISIDMLNRFKIASILKTFESFDESVSILPD